MLAVTCFPPVGLPLVRAAYLAMGLSGWFIIVPSSFMALLTGVVQAVGTPWGLFKHYWVLVKLLLTVAATVLLLVHRQPISYLAGVAAKADPSPSTELRGMRVRLIADAVAVLVVLLAATPFGTGSMRWRCTACTASTRNSSCSGSRTAPCRATVSGATGSTPTRVHGRTRPANHASPTPNSVSLPAHVPALLGVILLKPTRSAYPNPDSHENPSV